MMVMVVEGATAVSEAVASRKRRKKRKKKIATWKMYLMCPEQERMARACSHFWLGWSGEWMVFSVLTMSTEHLQRLSSTELALPGHS